MSGVGLGFGNGFWGKAVGFPTLRVPGSALFVREGERERVSARECVCVCERERE